MGADLTATGVLKCPDDDDGALCFHPRVPADADTVLSWAAGTASGLPEEPEAGAAMLVDPSSDTSTAGTEQAAARSEQVRAARLAWRG